MPIACGTDAVFSEGLQIDLPHKDELIGMAIRSDTLAVGSNEHVMFIDPRNRGRTHHVTAVGSIDGRQVCGCMP